MSNEVQRWIKVTKVAKTTLVDAINLALAYEMAADPDVVLLGEDIGVNGVYFGPQTACRKHSVRSGSLTHHCLRR